MGDEGVIRGTITNKGTITVSGGSLINTGTIVQSESPALLDLSSGAAVTESDLPDASALGTITGKNGIAPTVTLNNTPATAVSQYKALGTGVVKMTAGKVNANQYTPEANGSEFQMLAIFNADEGKDYIAQIKTSGDTVYNEVMKSDSAGIHCFYITVGDAGKTANNDLNSWGDSDWCKTQTKPAKFSAADAATGADALVSDGIDGTDYVVTVTEATVTLAQAQSDGQGE